MMTVRTRTWQVGCYSAPGRPGGIATLVTSASSGLVLAQTSWIGAENASYLARSGRQIVYAALENTNGQVQAFTADGDGGLRPHGVARATGGAGPCHVWVQDGGKHLIACNYGSGSVSVHRILPDGALAEATDVVRHAQAGSERAREQYPTAHPHMATGSTGAGGEAQVLVADLGTDRIHRYLLREDTGTLESTGLLPLPAGSGPRHLAVCGQYAYVAGELASTVSVADLSAREAKAAVLATVRTTSETGASFPSAIKMSGDGRFCYLANRGPDTVAVFAVDGPRIRFVTEVPCGGRNPRDLALAPGGHHLYVANQGSDGIQAFVIDPRTGLPTAVGEPWRISQPACLLPDASRRTGWDEGPAGPG